MSGAAVPDANLAWTQGETAGTCKAAMRSMQRASRPSCRRLIGPRTVFLCWGLAKLTYGLEELRPAEVLQQELVAAGWGWIIYGLRLPSVGVVGPCAVWGHAEKRKGRACLFN